MEDALYFPIHRAKAGEIAGIGRLSPLTRTRVRPTFEIQKQAADDDAPPEEYLAGVGQQLLESWGNRYPLYADFLQFGPEQKTADGKHCAEHLFTCLRQQSMLAIPVAGPESVRGPGYDYLEAVARIAKRDGRGAALRIPFEEFSDSQKLSFAIEDSLRVLSLQPELIDLFLDFEALSMLPADARSSAAIVTAVSEAVAKIGEAGFRNVIVCGSSVPERVSKQYDWGALRVERSEFLAWQLLTAAADKLFVKFADYGPIYALEQDTNSPVRPPARIRLSTPTEHVMWRAPRKDYMRLCEQVVASKDFDPDLAAWGATVLYQCARFGRGKGGPTEWVARDTNLHVEVTVRAIESALRRAGLLATLSFAEPESFAWNQAGIDQSLDA